MGVSLRSIMAVILVFLCGGSHNTEADEPLRAVAFAPFRDCQSPDLRKFPSQAEMRKDVDLAATMSNGLRTYSTLNGMDDAAQYAQSRGLRVSAGAWLGPQRNPEEEAANRQEIEALVALAKRVDLESVIVGNEVLLRRDLTVDQLTGYIREVKQRLPGVLVTTAEIASIALNPKNRKVIEEVDYFMAHIYPYWDGVDIDGAAWYVADTFRDAEIKTGKKVVIGETGWPSSGPPNKKAVPDVANAERFLREWIAVARDEKIDYYYFAANDEGWKQEGGVGAYWGMVNAERAPKHGITSLLADPGPAPARLPKQAEGSAGPPLSGDYAAISAIGGPAPLPDVFTIYDDWSVATGRYAPSGHSGDLNDIELDDCHQQEPHGGKTAIRAGYRATATAKEGWAAVSWLLPGTDWGAKEGGWNLTGYSTLSFYARGGKGGETVTFSFGGVTGTYGDTAAKEEITVKLTPAWERYAISLSGADLTRVVKAFGWAASRKDNPSGATFYLDTVQLDHTPPPRRPCRDLPEGAHAQTLYLLDGTLLCSANSPVRQYDFGVDTSQQQRTWLSLEPDSLRMAYPAGQSWGAVFLTVGKPEPLGQRSGQDVTSCHTLQADLRSDSGRPIQVGMKDTTMRDDGGEKKILVTPSAEWSTYSFWLNSFTGVNRSRAYILAEFVFSGDQAQTVFVRDIRLLCGNSPLPPQSGSPVRRTCLDLPSSAPRGTRYVLDGTTLCPQWSPVRRYGVGIDTSGQQRNWLSTSGGGLKMAYPAGQDWGAMFITVGNPVPSDRPGQDMSTCHTLKVDLRSDTPGTQIGIGMKDRFMPDNGSETKIPVTVSGTWATHTISLSGFGGLNRAAVYVIAEFVFSGQAAQTVYVRNLRFTC